MRTVRLTEEEERKLDYLARQKNVSRSQVIREALESYFDQAEVGRSSFEKGKALFGKFRSGEAGRSKERKERIHQKIRRKRDEGSGVSRDARGRSWPESGEDKNGNPESGYQVD